MRSYLLKRFLEDLKSKRVLSHCIVVYVVHLVVNWKKRKGMKLKILWGWLMVSGNYYLCPAQLFLCSRIEFINVKPNAESGCFSFYQLYATEYKITTKLSWHSILNVDNSITTLHMYHPNYMKMIYITTKVI